MILSDFKCLFPVNVQKFREDHFKKWLFDIIADKHPNKMIFWNTKLTLYFIKYDIKR